MEQKSNDLKDNCLQKLFESAIWFDRDKVFNLTRKAVKDIPGKVKKEFFKGFSRPDKISYDELEKLFRKILKNKSKYDLSYQVIKYSFFPGIFNSAIQLFKAVFFSDPNLAIEERIKNTIVQVSNQFGWSTDVVNCIVNFNPNILMKYISNKDQSIFNELNDLHKIKNDFQLSLTKDAVKAWRNNFVLEPYSVFFEVPSSKGIRSSKWDLISEAVKNKGVSVAASALSEMVDKEDGDFEFLAQASVNLILLGIDLNKNELVSLGIKKIEDKILGKRINEVQEVRLLTTIALGYAFLKKIISAMKTLSRLHDQDFTVEVLGFAGSLASMAERSEEAAVLFYLAFQQRESPLTWPLKALIDLDPILADPINSLFVEGKISDSIDIHDGKKITNLIFNSHPEWFEQISNITDFLKKLGQEKKKTIEEHEEKEKVIEDKLKTRKKFGEAELLFKNNFPKELHQLLDHREKIIKAEQELIEAQGRREWLSVGEIATNLDKIWKDSMDEVRKIISDLNLKKSLLESLPLSSLLNGERNPSLIVDAIELFSALYIDKRRSQREELNTKKAVLLSRLRNVNLDYLWPKEELTEGEFLKYQENTLPKITRAEKIKDIEKGLYTASTFLTNFPVESERQSIIEEIMNKVGEGTIFVNKNLTEIVCSVNWDSSKAHGILDNFLTGTRKKFEKAKIEEKHMSDIILPIIINISSLIGIPPLLVVLQNPMIIESVNSFLVSSENEIMRQLLKSLVDNKNNLFPSKLVEYGRKFGTLEHAREFLLKWIDFDKDLIPEKKVKMLSIWVDSIAEITTNGETLKEIKMLKRLRDALIEDNRQAEATLLVSTIWRASGDYRILEGFENVFYQVLVDLLMKGEKSKAFVSIILENPEWLIEQSGGVPLFLYLCHIGDLSYLVEQIKYQFFNDFEEARKKYSVLIDEFFLKTRFPEDPFQTDSELLSDSEIILGLQAIKEMDHDLLKTSCYKSWLPASDYQAFFNQRIIELKDRILRSDEAQITELDNEIKSIHPSKWIQDGDRNLRHKVKHPVYELMEKYLAEQITRLKILMNIKKKIGGKDLILHLCSKSKPLKERLLGECNHLINPSKEVVQIYNKIAETMQ